MRALALLIFALAALGCVASHEPVPDDAPLPGDLLEIDLTDAQRAAFCDWWMDRHGGEATILICPPPPAEGLVAVGVSCGLGARVAPTRSLNSTGPEPPQIRTWRFPPSGSSADGGSRSRQLSPALLGQRIVPVATTPIVDGHEGLAIACRMSSLRYPHEFR